MESRGEVIQTRVAAGYANDRPLGLLQAFDVLERGPEDLLDPNEALPLARLGQLEDALLGSIDDLFDLVAARTVRLLDGLGSRFDQAAEQRALLDDAAVILDVSGRGNSLHQFRQIGGAANRFQLAPAPQLFRQRHRIDDLTALEQTLHSAEEPPVRLTVEGVVVDQIDGLGHGVAIDQHAAQNRDLALGRPGCYPVGEGLVGARHPSCVSQRHRAGFAHRTRRRYSSAV